MDNKQDINIHSQLNNLLGRSDCVKQLCKPLYHSMSINYFNYVRLFDENKRVILTDRPDYIDCFYSNQQYKKSNVQEIESRENSEVFTWDVFGDTYTFNFACEQFDIANGITITKTFPGYKELYYFGTSKNNLNACDFFYKNRVVFENFILFFKDRAKNLLSYAARQPLLLEGTCNNLRGEYKNKFLDILMDSNSVRFVDQSVFPHVILSAQESRCAALFFLQFSSKEISDCLKISPRTFEKHISNIKIKLKCVGKLELINKLYGTKIIDLENKSFCFNVSDDNVYMNEHFDAHFLTEIKKINLYYKNNMIISLSEKESLCLILYFYGFSAKLIAYMLEVSNRTVEKYISNIYLKFNIKCRSELIQITINYNLVDMICTAFKNSIEQLLVPSISYRFEEINFFLKTNLLHKVI